MLAEAAQQAGLPRAFVSRDRDEAGRKREQFGGRHHPRTIAQPPARAPREMRRKLINPAYAPGRRYLIAPAFFMAAIASSTLSSTIVCNELNAPPALIAKAFAAIAMLSGAS